LLKHAFIKGCGSYLPEKIVTNSDLTKIIDTTDEWIVNRTGIRQRHIAAENQNTSDLAIKAGENALAHAELLPTDIDILILATTTPDKTFPATATTVQSKLGMKKGAAFDIQAVCSGFVFGMSIANSFIKSGQANTVMVVGAETFSRILDWKDRGTCVLFGDGAGAVILQSTRINNSKIINSSILSTHLHSDGSTNDLLFVDGGPSSSQTVGHVRMAGKEVFRHAVTNLTSVVKETLEANNMTIEDIDWLVPHQANKRILDSTAKKLNLSKDKIIITLDRHANTSAASIPLALDEAVRDGRINRGDIVLMEAMGGGLTWGSILIRW